MKKCLFLWIFLPVLSQGQVQAGMHYADEVARKAPKQGSPTQLADYFRSRSKDEYELARMLFTWMTVHVRYDANGYNTGRFADCTPSAVWKNRVAVCSGFAALYQSLCQAGGLECKVVSGYAKGFDYRNDKRLKEVNHDWNVVRTNGRWILVDVTWGEGFATSAGKGISAVKKFDPFWFDTPPEAFVFSHLPEEASSHLQLIESPLEMKHYERLPFFFPHELMDPALNRERLDAVRR